jgi:hypothetical protein
VSSVDELKLSLVAYSGDIACNEGEMVNEFWIVNMKL